MIALTVAGYAILGLVVGPLAARWMAEDDVKRGGRTARWSDTMLGGTSLFLAVLWPLVFIGFALAWVSKRIGQALRAYPRRSAAAEVSDD